MTLLIFLLHTPQNLEETSRSAPPTNTLPPHTQFHKANLSSEACVNEEEPSLSSHEVYRPDLTIFWQEPPERKTDEWKNRTEILDVKDHLFRRAVVFVQVSSYVSFLRVSFHTIVTLLRGAAGARDFIAVHMRTTALFRDRTSTPIDYPLRPGSLGGRAEVSESLRNIQM